MALLPMSKKLIMSNRGNITIERCIANLLEKTQKKHPQITKILFTGKTIL
jgi:hypothetical protein